MTILSVINLCIEPIIIHNIKIRNREENVIFDVKRNENVLDGEVGHDDGSKEHEYS